MEILSVEKRESIRRIIGTKRHGWPTLLLFALGVGLFLGAWSLAWQGSLGRIYFFGLIFLSQYFLYTCMHEAVHRLVSPWAWLNQLVGMVSATSLFAPFLGFQHVHLKHHRFTNHAEKDPDLWSAKSFLPLRWVTQDIWYYFVYLRDHSALPKRIQAGVGLQFFLNLGILFWLLKIGKGELILWGWFLPSRLVVFWLGFVFNFLPHHPHLVTPETNSYNETCVRPAAWLTPVLLFQNFHNVHHLFPASPFYRYGRIWREVGPDLLRLGTVSKKGFWP